jgi:hypothetical protein
MIFMRKITKIVLIVCGIALISRTMDQMKEDKEKSQDISSVTSSELIGVTTVAHTEQAETYYGLPSWQWSKADIYSYSNGWNNVKFYDSSGREVESNWYPSNRRGGA